MNAMSNMSTSQSGVDLKKTEMADKKQLELYKKLYDLREQLFDAPSDVKKSFNDVVKYFSSDKGKVDPNKINVLTRHGKIRNYTKEEVDKLIKESLDKAKENKAWSTNENFKNDWQLYKTNAEGAENYAKALKNAKPGDLIPWLKFYAEAGRKHKYSGYDWDSASENLYKELINK